MCVYNLNTHAYMHTLMTCIAPIFVTCNYRNTDIEAQVQIF